MSPSCFQLKSDGEVAEILFDDGGMNLLSSSALIELEQLQESLPPGLTLLGFRSGRERIFAAGADMQEMAGFTAGDAAAFSELGQRVFASIERLPMITVALIDGDCFGGALDLVLAFDFRFATERSRFSHPGARIGIVTGFGGTSRWRKVLAPQRARRMFLANEILTAQEAMEAELVDGLWSDDLACRRDAGVPAGGTPALPGVDLRALRSQHAWTADRERIRLVKELLSKNQAGAFN